MKVIISIKNMPNNCRNVRGDKENVCHFGGMVCKITEKDVMKHVVSGTKPDFCPLEEIPEKLDVKSAKTFTDLGWIGGWNACIQKIEGK